MKYLILGAGPAGLSLACSLLKRGETDFLVIEKEEEAGGLCRSRMVDGSPLDIGGGHFLDVRRPKVDEFLFEYMPESEWDLYERDSRIVVNDNVIGSPIEANIWQMKIDDQVEYLKAVATAGCNTGEPMPERFVDWIFWKLGSRVADDYMIPYNQKMFGDNLNELGTYWLEKLPNVSFEETLRSCLEHKAYGTQPGHAKFYYPKKYGYGEVWLRMARSLGDKLITGTKVTSLDLDRRTVNGTYSADRIIVTIPWIGIDQISGLSGEMEDHLKKLKKSSVRISYFDRKLDTPCHWIYYPDRELSYHRILVRHNFCPGSKGYWTETNETRAIRKDQGEKFRDSSDTPSYFYQNEYAYPLNTIGKQEAMAELLSYTEQKGVTGLGRWGEWQHYNSDVVVERAMNLAENI